jgi:hypothetical protein
VESILSDRVSGMEQSRGRLGDCGAVQCALSTELDKFLMSLACRGAPRSNGIVVLHVTRNIPNHISQILDKD